MDGWMDGWMDGSIDRVRVELLVYTIICLSFVFGGQA